MSAKFPRGGAGPFLARSLSGRRSRYDSKSPDGGTLNTNTYITLTVRHLIYAAREILLFLAYVGSKAQSILHTHAATPETSLLALLSGSK